MTESQPGKKTLVQKLAEVMGEVERVAKRGRNDFHKYDYATEADIMAAVREHMAKQGLIIVPDVEEISWRNDGTICTLKVAFTIFNGETVHTEEVSGHERITFRVYGEGQDKGDKATYKAMTGATKYALLKLFLIPTGDDPEHEPAPKDWNKVGRLTPAERKAARQTNEEALERAPYRDREVDPTTGEIVAPVPAQDPVEAVFEPMNPEEARKLDLSKALGQMREIANRLGVLPARRAEMWKIYCGDVRPMQADLPRVQQLVDFLRLAEKNGVDLNVDGASPRGTAWT